MKSTDSNTDVYLMLTSKKNVKIIGQYPAKFILRYSN